MKNIFKIFAFAVALSAAFSLHQFHLQAGSRPTYFKCAMLDLLSLFTLVKVRLTNA